MPSDSLAGRGELLDVRPDSTATVGVRPRGCGRDIRAAGQPSLTSWNGAPEGVGYRPQGYVV